MLSTEEQREIKQAIAAKKALRRDDFSRLFDMGHLVGWRKHHETHYSYKLLGEVLDYWPGPKKWRWKGRTICGEVFKFIAKKERQHRHKMRLEAKDAQVLE